MGERWRSCLNWSVAYELGYVTSANLSPLKGNTEISFSSSTSSLMLQQLFDGLQVVWEW